MKSLMIMITAGTLFSAAALAQSAPASVSAELESTLEIKPGSMA